MLTACESMSRSANTCQKDALLAQPRQRRPQQPEKLPQDALGASTNASVKAVGGPAPCGPMASGPVPPTRSRPPTCSSTPPSCAAAARVSPRPSGRGPPDPRRARLLHGTRQGAGTCMHATIILKRLDASGAQQRTSAPPRFRRLRAGSAPAPGAAPAVPARRARQGRTPQRRRPHASPPPPPGAPRPQRRPPRARPHTPAPARAAARAAQVHARVQPRRPRCSRAASHKARWAAHL